MSIYKEEIPEPEDFESESEYQRAMRRWYKFNRDPDDFDQPDDSDWYGYCDN